MTSKRDDGLAKTLAAFDRLKKEPAEAMMKAVMKSAQEVAAHAKALAPVESGALRDSITVTPPGGTAPAYPLPGGAIERHTAQPFEVLVTAGDAATPYAHYIHDGTKEIEANPFLRRAFRLLVQRAFRRIDRAGKKAAKMSWEG